MTLLGSDGPAAYDLTLAGTWAGGDLIIDSSPASYALNQDTTIAGTVNIISGTLRNDGGGAYDLTVGGNVLIGDGALPAAELNMGAETLTVGGTAFSRSAADGVYSFTQGNTVTFTNTTGTVAVSGFDDTGTPGQNYLYNLNAAATGQTMLMGSDMQLSGVFTATGSGLVIFNGPYHVAHKPILRFYRSRQAPRRLIIRVVLPLTAQRPVQQ